MLNRQRETLVDLLHKTLVDLLRETLVDLLLLYTIIGLIFVQKDVLILSFQELIVC